jgi:hypothetical protein
MIEGVLPSGCVVLPSTILRPLDLQLCICGTRIDRPIRAHVYMTRRGGLELVLLVNV